MILRTEEEIKAYYQGKQDGLRVYAWWKDGTQYVGTTGRTFLEALRELTRQEAEAHRNLSEEGEAWT